MTTEQIENNQEYLDEVAMRTMAAYIALKQPSGVKESIDLARVCYRVSLAMLSVKLQELETIADKEKLFHRYRTKEV